MAALGHLPGGDRGHVVGRDRQAHGHEERLGPGELRELSAPGHRQRGAQAAAGEDLLDAPGHVLEERRPFGEHLVQFELLVLDLPFGDDGLLALRLDAALQPPRLPCQALGLVLGAPVLVGDRPLQGMERVDVRQAPDAGQDVEPVEAAALVEGGGACREDLALQFEVVLGTGQTTTCELQLPVGGVQSDLCGAKVVADLLQFGLQGLHLGARAPGLLLQAVEGRSGCRTRRSRRSDRQCDAEQEEQRRHECRGPAPRRRPVCRGSDAVDHVHVLLLCLHYRLGGALLDRRTRG
ncbi:MAG: hypothetical protein BWY94_02018 [Actinobacteria bacterium ADurb.BinA094]|nr:MAG: hypothetical protein BWY94_02018 [Actinobacteria bacterium ADurb.BinA094]